MLSSFMELVGGVQPSVCFTDEDAWLRDAIERHMPKTKLLLCVLHFDAEWAMLVGHLPEECRGGDSLGIFQKHYGGPSCMHRSGGDVLQRRRCVHG